MDLDLLKNETLGIETMTAGTDQVTVLVIDDEQTMREGCSRILSKRGWSVLVAENGEKGLSQIQTHHDQIDAVLLDLMMPGVSGMEVLEQTRLLDPDLPVIVITGYATVESAVEAMKKGAYDFIPKPFTPDQLRLVVGRALERRAFQRETEFLRAERERSLRDISTEKSKIKTIIQAMGDGVLVCDQDGSIVLTNPAATRMLQASAEHLLGKTLAEAPIPAELSSTITEVLHTREKPYITISKELSVGTSGETYLRVHTAPVWNDLGQMMGTVTVLQDISHLKELDRMKSEFIAMVAHELRAPIATVDQQISAIVSRAAGELTEKQEEILSRAKERIKGLLTLIKDLLDLSKIEAGKMTQYKEPTVLEEVIQKVVDFMKIDAEKKKIDLQFVPPARSSLICGDRNNLEEIFTNLISNAIKYTPEQGKVTVTLGEESGYVKATVSDTGIGIKKEDLPHIFDAFYSTKESGHGLGLTICQRILQEHGAKIDVESRPGQGTAFTVWLPVRGPAEPPAGSEMGDGRCRAC
ncbi:MAG: ATP-binding protein [candidate division WOR-3 bacterium]